MTVWVGTGSSGSLVDDAHAQVSVFDHGFTVADGIFETMKTVDGRVFLWPWHLERLHHSASVLGLSLPDDRTLTAIVRDVAHVNAIPGAGRLRLTITGGQGPLGSDRGDVDVSVVCAASASKAWPATAQLHIAEWPRNEHSPLVTAKTTSYAENVLALDHAHARQSSEAIFFNTAGYLTEGTGSNIFVVANGAVHTPPLSAGLLAGVTRRFVMTLCDVVETAIDRALLAAADEVFLTSSTRDIQPVDRIGERAYAVGPIAPRLQERFAEAAAEDWCWL